MSHQRAEHRISKKIRWNSRLMAAYLVESLLCKIISIFISIPYISVLGMICIMVALLLTNQKLKINLFKHIFLIFGILVLLL